MNKKFIVPFDTARQLREKGYDVDCYSYYTQNGKLYHDTFTLNNKWIRMGRFLAPTYHEVVDWLEEKGYLIETMCIRYESNVVWFCRVAQKDTNIYPTREQALNASIITALEML